jgi:F-BAR domain only protein
MLQLTLPSVFTSPWQKIIEATSTLAQSHHNLSQNIGVDVEAPLRDFTSMNREMQNISTMTGNIQSIAKEFENANKRADKLKDKGGKAAADKVANAASSVEDAKGQWDSQAPYVFEKLQAVDEARLDHLRNCLTQFQTHVIEANSSVSSGAEECLNALLNVQTSDEIQRFSMRAPSSATTRARERRQSRSQPVSAPTTSSLAPPSIPLAATTEDAASQRSSSCM